MHLEYQLNADDYADAQVLHQRRGKRHWFLMAIFGSVGVVSAIMLLQQGRDSGLLAPVAGVWMGFLFFLFTFSRISHRRRFRKIKALQLPVQINLDDEGIGFHENFLVTMIAMESK